MNRLDQLFAFLKEDPNDPFNIYAIALELSKSNAYKAMEYYEILLKKYPEYVPAYYHAARLQEELGNKEESEKIYIKGMEVSKNANQLKAFRELQGAYRQLIEMNDDDE